MKDTVKVTKKGSTLQVDVKEGNQERWLSLSLEQGIELMWKLEKELQVCNDPEVIRELEYDDFMSEYSALDGD